MPVPIPPRKIHCQDCDWRTVLPGNESDALINPRAIAPDQCPECGSTTLKTAPLDMMEKLFYALRNELG